MRFGFVRPAALLCACALALGCGAKGPTPCTTDAQCGADAHCDTTPLHSVCTCNDGFAGDGTTCEDARAPWTRQVGTSGDDLATALAVSAEGDVFVVGGSEGDFDGGKLTGAAIPSWNLDVVVSRYSATGKRRWTREFGTPDTDLGRAVALDSAGNVLVAGHTTGDFVTGVRPATPDARGFLAKLDPSGTRRWLVTFDAAGFGALDAVVPDANDDVYVTGFTWGAFDGATNAGDADCFVAKVSAAGKRLWTRQFGRSKRDFCQRAVVDAAGAVYVGGMSEHADGKGFDVVAAKFDAQGNQQWLTIAEEQGGERISGLFLAGDGSLVVGSQVVDVDFDTAVRLTTLSPKGERGEIREVLLNPNEILHAVLPGPGGTILYAGNGKEKATTEVDASDGLEGDFVREADPATGAVQARHDVAQQGVKLFAIAQAPGGLLFAAGKLTSALDGARNAGRSDLFLVKF